MKQNASQTKDQATNDKQKGRKKQNKNGIYTTSNENNPNYIKFYTLIPCTVDIYSKIFANRVFIS